MASHQPSDFTLHLFVAASILSLASLGLLAFGPPASADAFILRKPLVGLIFSTVCFLGALAVVTPSTCNAILGAKGKGGSFGFHSASASPHVLRGHHFDCEGYVSHTINFNGRTLCAACSGLFVGAAVAIFAAAAYFFLNAELGQFGSGFLVIGMVLVALGFIQFEFPGFSRLLVNALFVFGAFLVVLAVDVIMENLFIDLYAISLTLLWILTRILLSQWDHSRICRSCTVDCELKK